MNQAAKAIQLARVHHEGQMYGDKPYMYHLEQVANKVTQYLNYEMDDLTYQQLIATAYLHDIVEDTDATEMTLVNAGIAFPIIRAVMLLSKRDDVPYHLYIDCIKMNPVARIVKLCDTVSNLEHSIKEGRLKNINKYTKQIQLLGGFDVR